RGAADSLHRAPDEPHDGWRGCQLRHAWRCDPRRAGRGDRVRCTACDQADARPGSPGRVPDRGVPARPRDARSGRASQGPQEHDQPAAAAHERQAGRIRVVVALSGYGAALDYLYALTTGAFKFGLERTRALLAEMGDPHLAVPTLHIAGTNGK